MASKNRALPLPPSPSHAFKNLSPSLASIPQPFPSHAFLFLFKQCKWEVLTMVLLLCIDWNEMNGIGVFHGIFIDQYNGFTVKPALNMTKTC
ncbi:hypothetical protein RHGRI_020382 [Rhododendron griersonianum]|uniref:Uncharacterized protein n=1 Tax=Rhododendron griersonianum TaxID=479676 RepID=A0AAV6JI49_9ERIC|nr:hypothetical protein RHGRI_020382 [Rhododendron griersonianum]